MKWGKIMYISGSVLAVKENYQGYAQLLKKSCVDYMHVDIFQNDERFSLGDLSLFRGNSLPLDLHLIYETFSNEDIEAVNQANAKFINIQYETLKNKSTVKLLSKKVVGSFGIALTAETPLDVIDENINCISQVLVMCSHPGISGAKFNTDNYKRIEKIRHKYPTLKIWVDGGIDNIIAEKLGRLNADVIVSGSYLCRDLKNLYVPTYKLKYMNEHNVKVTRNMLHLNELPIVGEEAGFADIIIKMNSYRMGAVLIVKEEKLKGIITDGDVRRAILKYGKDIFEKRSRELMNRSPFVIDSGKTMEEVFEILTQKRKRTDFIPVIESGKLAGAVDLHIGR